MEIRPHWLTGLLLVLLALVQALLWPTPFDPALGPAAAVTVSSSAEATALSASVHGQAFDGNQAVGSLAVAIALTCQWLVGLGTLLPPGRRWVGWLAVAAAATLHAQIVRYWWGSSWEAALATLLALSALQSVLLRIGRFELRPLSVAPPRLPRSQLSIGDFFVATTLLAVLWRLAGTLEGAAAGGPSGRSSLAAGWETFLIGARGLGGTSHFGWHSVSAVAIASLLIGLASGLIAWDTQISRWARVANQPHREA
jgi:hypothetical protein